MNNQKLLGRILLCLGIVLGAYVFFGDVTKALSISAMIVAACVLIRGY
jgi:hypothetical protein